MIWGFLDLGKLLRNSCFLANYLLLFAAYLTMTLLTTTQVIQKVQLRESLAYAELSNINLAGAQLSGGQFFSAYLRTANLCELPTTNSYGMWLGLLSSTSFRLGS